MSFSSGVPRKTWYNEYMALFCDMKSFYVSLSLVSKILLDTSSY